jgi:hypothetical protein
MHNAIPKTRFAMNASRYIQALTGRLTKTTTQLGATEQRDARDCSDLRLRRLAHLSPNQKSKIEMNPFLPGISFAIFAINPGPSVVVSC